MTIAVIDYGMGNLGSVRRAFEDLGCTVEVCSDPARLVAAERIVLPGVGAFGQGMERLRAQGSVDAVVEAVAGRKAPLLGICLGMQMLATVGEEGGRDQPGLGLIDGRVKHLADIGCRLRVPHVGWNEVAFESTGAPLFDHVPQRSDFYFVHSFAFEPSHTQHILARADYGIDVVAAVRAEHVFGTQFHPEKSSGAGRQVLRNFVEWSAC